MQNSKQQSDDPPTVLIPLSNGIHFAVIDRQDYERVRERKWHALRNRKGDVIYAACNIEKSEARRLGVKCKEGPPQRGKPNQKQYTKLCLHQFILGSSDGKIIDHKDGDPLNNRRSNLRHTNLQGNAANQKKHANWSSPYKGVTWSKQSRKWVAAIYRKRKRYHLGLYSNQEDAARAFDAKARKLSGSMARTNFPTEGDSNA